MRRAALVLALVGVACAKDPPSFVGVDVASGLPVSLRPTNAQRNFSGNYLSPHVGELHLEQSESALSGRYHYETDGHRIVGSLHGHVRGNLAEVEWEEHQVVGPETARIGGVGFFLYDPPDTVSASAAERRPVRLFGRRLIATRLLPTPSDEHYAWLNLGKRDEVWTAVEIVRTGARP